MSTDRQLAETISRWLEADAPTQLPDRVLRATFERTRTTRQERGWHAPPGGLHMNRLVPIGLGAAAVIGAVFVGAQLFGSTGDGGPGAAPVTTPAPSVSPSIAPTVTPSDAAPSPVGGLPVGPYALLGGTGALGPGGVSMTVTIPAPGWFGDEGGGGILVKDDTAAPPGGAGMIVFVRGDGWYVPRDPCAWDSTMPDFRSTSVDELVAALAAQASRDASALADIAVGGYAGKSITLHVPDDAVLAGCHEGQFCTMANSEVATADTCERYAQGPGQIDTLWIVEVEGQLVVIDWGHYAATPAEHVAELQAIVDSITFE